MKYIITLGIAIALGIIAAVNLIPKPETPVAGIGAPIQSEPTPVIVTTEDFLAVMESNIIRAKQEITINGKADVVDVYVDKALYNECRQYGGDPAGCQATVEAHLKMLIESEILTKQMMEQAEQMKPKDNTDYWSEFDPKLLEI